MEEEKVTTTAESISAFNKLKKRLSDFKFMLRGWTFLIGIGLIVFMTWAQVDFDINKIEWNTWIGNTMLITAIQIFGLLMGEPTGKDALMKRETGRYQLSCREFKLAKAKAEPNIAYFDDYYNNVYKPEAYIQTKADFLVANCSMDDAEADAIARYCSISDVRKLVSEPLLFKSKDGEDVRILEITEEQCNEALRMFSKGKDNPIKFEASSASYFKSINMDVEYRNYAVAGKIIQRKRMFNSHFNRIVKIVSSIIISAIWAAYTVKDFAEAGDNTAWMNLISRLTALVTSTLAGVSSGAVDVSLMSDENDVRTGMLSEFSAAINVTFFPKSRKQRWEEEKAKAEELKKEVEVIERTDSQSPLLIRQGGN